jgi:hypothetical protein
MANYIRSSVPNDQVIETYEGCSRNWWCHICRAGTGFYGCLRNRFKMSVRRADFGLRFDLQNVGV